MSGTATTLFTKWGSFVTALVFQKSDGAPLQDWTSRLLGL
jgi:hypothetical protein